MIQRNGAWQAQVCLAFVSVAEFTLKSKLNVIFEKHY